MAAGCLSDTLMGAELGVLKRRHLLLPKQRVINVFLLWKEDLSLNVQNYLVTCFCLHHLKINKKKYLP